MLQARRRNEEEMAGDTNQGAGICTPLAMVESAPTPLERFESPAIKANISLLAPRHRSGSWGRHCFMQNPVTRHRLQVAPHGATG